jgi:hypothetical protein
MTWDAHHRRGEVLRNVVDEVNLRRDGSLPTELPGVAETFSDDLDLVAALQLRWHTRLSGRIDRALLEEPSDLERAVITAWRATAGEMPGVRAVLDAHLAEPTGPAMAEALETARAKERALLAAMAGKASAQDAAAARVGATLEDRARAGWTLTVPARGPRSHRGDDRPTLIGRLKAVLAA